MRENGKGRMSGRTKQAILAAKVGITLLSPIHIDSVIT
jgi:hypothetical protein